MNISPRKPEWLKMRLPGGPQYGKVKDVLSRMGLHTICREARCPNLAECFSKGTATFLILGNVCTRNCLYCNVSHYIPNKPNDDEPANLVKAIRMIGLHYVVITSVSRDDLDDGGASYFVSCVEKIRAELPGCEVELLIPDFRGSTKALQQVFDSYPNVISHNMEVAPALFDRIRPEGNYRLSLQLLKHIKRFNEECAQQYHVTAKSGFMVGFGETRKDIEVLLSDIFATGCRYVTIGQYQQPTMRHWPVAKYYHPEEFAEIKTMASAMGFDHVESGPHVRSSYRASFACPKPYQWTNSF